MTQAVRFLISFGRALSMSSLYQAGHPTLERALDAAWTDLQDLLAVVASADVHLPRRERPVRRRAAAGTARWEWSSRLSGCGIQRVQFEPPIDRERFVAFLLDVNARLAGHPPAPVPARPGAPGGIRLGAVGLRDTAPPSDAPIRTATLAFNLDVEIDTARWVQQEVSDRHADSTAGGRGDGPLAVGGDARPPAGHPAARATAGVRPVHDGAFAQCVRTRDGHGRAAGAGGRRGSRLRRRGPAARHRQDANPARHPQQARSPHGVRARRDEPAPGRRGPPDPRSRTRTSTSRPSWHTSTTS